jgi:hypothetical protein
MNTLTDKNTVQASQASAKRVRFTAGKLHVPLNDGRAFSLPLAEGPWLKWLAKATPKQRANWSLEPGGFAIYWPDLDDGVEVCHLLNSQAIA